MDANSLWDEINSLLKNDFTAVSYRTWFSNVKPLKLDHDQLTLQLPSVLHVEYWQKNISSKVIEYAFQLTGKDITPVLMTENQVKDEQQAQAEPLLYPTESDESDQLDPNYTFDKFVVGKQNMFAQAAALSVAEDPGVTYNPLLIYGGVGLGKTHLMQAIGNYMLEQDPSKNVVFITSEKFTNEFVSAVKDSSHGGTEMERFKEKYRNVDLLLVDDIQFFSSKDKTQEEFFHTFNELRNDKKQIVMTSDRLPNEISKLQDRLVSRFNWGLSVSIEEPDVATRTKILQSKAKYSKISITEEALEYLAKQVDSNVRELESALSQVKAFSDFNGGPSRINIPMVKSAISNHDFASKVDHNVDIEDILEGVSAYYNVSIDDIKGKKRYKEIVAPRQVAMYLSRELTKTSLPKIGEAFGGKDHTTVIHAYDKIKRALDNNDPQIKDEVADLKMELLR
ncbi:chromosomal replication initiator protein DnaA [Nicoliella spurrieriana]|uniref:Chromosomal replication initiator protein DnaA n=1 Tax=Nicoliella spurrieriana TaxID=2925830 RepID=A0A976X6A2_9LACO|nr:chromosomal replication initiator protein DnaA [Nicoliella spurrieriana]UQS87242.1 chromosomal replication initiator protein DnaA [Nicoliella spurrieriana]